MSAWFLDSELSTCYYIIIIIITSLRTTNQVISAQITHV